MKKEKTNGEWVAFGEKIVYLHEKLFEKDKERLVYYFTDHSLKKSQKSRKKTIENWLDNKTKKPNGFHFSKFKISEFMLNSEKLLTPLAFQKWSLEMFQKRIDRYLSEKHTSNTNNEMKYIYFFSTIEKRLSYFKISYPDAENQSIVHLNSPIYTSSMTYIGDITNYQNMIYIAVKNEFDYMHYIFKNNVNVYRKELNIFGVAQCVDAPTREPKAYLALLTSKKLTLEEERRFAHKLNFSNIMIADDFTHGCFLERDYFLENFSEKIYALSRDIEHYGINKAFAQDMYFDIVVKEYRSYIKLLEKSIYHSDYPINHKRHSILFALEEMCSEKKAKAQILYLLDSETLNILDSKNSIMEMQLKLVQEKRLTLSYLFIIENVSLITEKIIEQIKYIQAQGITVTLTTNSQSIYSKILIIEGKDFAIYKRKNEHNDNHVTKNATTIEALSYELEELTKNSISLEKFIRKNYPLNGRWYHYTYSSQMNNEHFQMVTFDIQNASVIAQFPNKRSKGTIMSSQEYTLILRDHSIVKIHNIHIRENIFRVSIIGKEKNMYHRDVLLFGLMSREKLSDTQVMVLLDSIHEKEDEVFRLKISNDFDSTLACFDINNNTMT